MKVTPLSPQLQCILCSLLQTLLLIGRHINSPLPARQYWNINMFDMMETGDHPPDSTVQSASGEKCLCHGKVGPQISNWSRAEYMSYS